MAQRASTDTLQNAVGATGNGTAVPMTGFHGLSILVTISATATVTFEGSLDDTNWFAVGMKTAADGVAVVTATATGAFKLPTDMPLSSFRARVSAWTSGTVSVVARRQV